MEPFCDACFRTGGLNNLAILVPGGKTTNAVYTVKY
jgi:hypothetical protein